MSGHHTAIQQQTGTPVKIFRCVLVMVLLVHFVLTPVFQVGAEEKQEQKIRVALFVDIGKGFQLTVPTVTLSGEYGMDIGVRTDSGISVYEQVKGEAGRRFSPDGYYILAAETTNSTEAQQIAQRISGTGIKAEIQYILKSGKPVFQVVAGRSPVRSEAEKKQNEIAQKTGVFGLLQGPFRVETGRFSSVQEAAEQVALLTEKNIDAYLVMVAGSGNTLEYRVWAGNETSASESQALAQQIQQSTGLAANPSPEASNYLLVKQDAVLSGNQQEALTHYVFSPGQKVVVSPREGNGSRPPLIQVEEKGNRAYRGMMELSVYQQAFTLVNELPMHEYLYGVVGSEMASGWPIEALKAQAVLARTFALGRGNQYGVANLSDTVWDQAYYGYSKESPDIRQAVDETRGEVLLYQGRLAEAFYYSNAGGMTADGSEVWGNRVPYMVPVSSPDTIPMDAADLWYQVALMDGEIGYVHAEFITKTSEKNPIGLAYGIVNTDNLNFRTGPDRRESPSVRSLSRGMQVVILDEVKESNPYHWIRGPYTGREMMEIINENQKLYNAPLLSAPVRHLSVTRYGPSERVMEVKADGIRVESRTPDSYRSVFRVNDKSLRSTRFTIEETGSFTVLGANGRTVSYPKNGGQATLYAISGGDNQYVSSQLNGDSGSFVLYNAKGDLRVATLYPAFKFVGYGYGHGLGMSQYGAKAMALEGYGYREILQHYYQGVTIQTYP
ncbi:MAG: SpoIID/LytB domain-containing protein [Bacillaceae bacterium]|nr:SpoIID/LytB domain-containing protein [Bacillaceae bacterium]